jgi:hypothetical protein
MLYRLLILAIVGFGLVLTEVGCSQAQPQMDKSKGSGAGMGSSGSGGVRRMRVGN